jgi:hypothetical protein
MISPGSRRLLASLLVGFGSSFVLIGMGVAQTSPTNISIPKTVLKKLYDGIEDMKLKYSVRNVERPSLYDQDSIDLTKILVKNHVKTNQTCGAESGSMPIRDVGVNAKVFGSFTKPRTKQILYAYSTCTFGFGLAILESGKLVVAYDAEHYFSVFLVKDINKNGLNEVMFEIQSKADGVWAEMHAIQLLELKDFKPYSFGSFFIGGPPNVYAGGGDWVTCSSRAPRELQKSFPSNILYVHKGKTPQFFIEGYEINCDYRNVGIKVRKVSDLTPIKPVPRGTGLERTY